MTNIPHAFHYGAPEPTAPSAGHDEKPQQPPETGEPQPQQSPGRIEPPTGNRGRGPLTTRLVLLGLTIILLGTTAGLAGALLLPKSYAARAEILYSLSQGQQGGDPAKQDRQLSTQLVYLKSPTVLAPVARKQGRQFTDLDNDVSVEVLANSQVIQVEAHGASTLTATQTLQAIIASYLALIGQPTGVSRNLDTQLADAKTTTAQTQTRVTQLTTAVLAGTATQTSLNDARAQLTASLDRDKAIQARIEALKLTGQTGPNAQLLTPPYALPDPVFPQPLITANIGALVGLIAASGIVAVSARRRRGGA